MPDLTQAYQPTQGTDGRVKKHDATNPIILAGVTSWRRVAFTRAIPMANFNSPKDALTGTTQPNIVKGLGGNKVRIKGYVNLDETDQTETGRTGLTNGASVALDLYGSKSDQVGYANVVGLVTEFSLGQETENGIFEYEAEVTVDGPFPAWGGI